MNHNDIDTKMDKSALDYLVAEMLGDVGKLNHEVISLKKSLPELTGELRKAVSESIEKLEQKIIQLNEKAEQVTGNAVTQSRAQPVSTQQVAVGKSDAATKFAMAVAAIMIALAGAFMGGVLMRFQTKTMSVTDQFGSVNDIAAMMSCRNGQVKSYRGREDEAWCVLNARDPNTGTNAVVAAWRVK